MMDPIVLCYGKGQLTGFLVDPNGVLDVVSNHFLIHTSNCGTLMFDELTLDQTTDYRFQQTWLSMQHWLPLQDME